ncbi:Cupredoxin [Artemisia annua]|uniref:Cupredoxin n=1 Tax=Artemisia annua TaxID=35608 RepID=A0A2U1N3C3_ARTAN|nr:Cupredoxin [Artemisia annua]
MPSLAKVYTVGDSAGWALGVDYKTWTSGKTFKVGDSLVFNYGSSHSVAEVSSSDYGTCSVSNSITTYNNGPTTVALNTSGTHYFVCGVVGHCGSGMKVSVPVTGDGGHDEESGSSRQRQTKRKRETITVEEALMPVVSHPHLLWRTCNTQTRKVYNKLKPDLAGPETVRPPPPPKEKKNSLVEGVETMETKMELVEKKVDRILYHSDIYALVLEELGKIHNIKMGEYSPPSVSEQAEGGRRERNQ